MRDMLEDLVGISEAQAKALVPVPEALREAWTEAVRRCRSDRLRQALYLVALGNSYKLAAEYFSLSPQAVYEAARRYGLAQLKTEAQIERAHSIVHLAGAELERRLVESPAEFSGKDLYTMRGVEVDKIAKREAWGTKREDRAGYVAGLAALIREARASGKVSLSIEVERGTTARDALEASSDTVDADFSIEDDDDETADSDEQTPEL